MGIYKPHTFFLAPVYMHFNKYETLNRFCMCGVVQAGVRGERQGVRTGLGQRRPPGPGSLVSRLGLQESK